MCLYMSVPQWLNLQNFLKAINESINHTIEVSFMFIYLKCLNNRNNNKKQNAAIKTAETTAKQNAAAAAQTNQDRNHKIDFNVNLTKINSFEMFPFHKTYSEIGQLERKLTMQHNKQKQYHYSHKYYNLPQQQQQQHQQHFCLYNNNDQLLLMDNKFKTIPLHI